jgi:hypothetical protein
MKLRITNQFGAPLNLQGCDGIKISLPYENGEVLEKSKVTVLDPNDGKIQIDLDDFEIQGLKVGHGQTFRGEAKFGDTTYHVVFAKGLNVELKNERKIIA